MGVKPPGGTGREPRPLAAGEFRPDPERMEAIGRLAGGIAHDFNNLLAIILGNAEALLARTEPDPRRTLRAEAIRDAADRGRAITRGLLAFAKRQRLDPEVRNLGDLVTALAPRLRRGVGDAVSVRLDIAEPAPNAEIDATQFEAALMNLAFNARDAMPGGGALTIAVRTLADDADAWAEIVVADTGGGMGAEVQARAFEPFFTTKGPGGGAGFGLAQLYGFIGQSGGEVRLTSAPGQGARFGMRLPIAHLTAAPRDALRPLPLPLGGSEQVLVVEDDPDVLRLTAEALRGQGYRVLTASDASGAMGELEANPEVELLFSDVVMPGVNGISLARQARRLRPRLRVLLTSGFMGDMVAESGEFPLIDKPYESDALAARLREVLDAPARGRGKRARRGPGRST